MYRPRPDKKAVLRPVYSFLSLPLVALLALFTLPRINFTGEHPGVIIDSLDGVYVYNNGPVWASYGRDTTPDGYNVGLKYQCVEFVKRYYLYHYGHRMSDTYGHAKHFFDPRLEDGQNNPGRGLVQFRNGSSHSPQKGDIIVLGPSVFNPYGHVAVISEVGCGWVEIVQQNSGRKNGSREILELDNLKGKFHIKNRRVQGWLRMNNK
ncbi:MAG: CHAP domain-containing protein [Rikenellaceae bacterium]|nr:CHAP domain-containing protein [Rikenellaceae bacterium]